MPGAGPLGLYVHVPFCAAICSYCNFNRGLFDESLKRRYVAALTREIERRGDGSHVDSIFFGGGTPSLLAAEEVSRVLGACRAAVDALIFPDCPRICSSTTGGRSVRLTTVNLPVCPKASTS